MNYGIKEVSKMVNLPHSTIRYYDKEGDSSLEERYKLFMERKKQYKHKLKLFRNNWI